MDRRQRTSLKQGINRGKLQNIPSTEYLYHCAPGSKLLKIVELSKNEGKSKHLFRKFYVFYFEAFVYTKFLLKILRLTNLPQ